MKQPTVNASQTTLQNSLQLVQASPGVSTNLVTGNAASDTKKSQESQAPIVVAVTADSDVPAQSKADTATLSSVEPKDERPNVVPSARPLLPRRTVRSKLVKLPQGGAVKKRTQATTSRPPPPNRTLPPPPKVELPPPPQVKQEQAAAAKETIGVKRKPAPAAPTPTKRTKAPAGLRPPLPVRRNPPSQTNRENPGQPPQSSTDVDVKDTKSRTDGTAKPARPPAPKSQPSLTPELPTAKEPVAQSASLKTVVTAVETPNNQSTSSQTLPVIDKPAPVVGISTGEMRTAARNAPSTTEIQATVKDKPVSSLKPLSGEKPSLSPKPVIARKPRPPLQATSQPPVAEKPPVSAKPELAKKPIARKPSPAVGPAVQRISVVTPKVEEDTKTASKGSISPPKSHRPPPPSVSLPPPPEASVPPSLAKETDRQLQPDVNALRPRPQKRLAPAGHAVVAPEKLVRPNQPRGLSKNGDIGHHISSEVESKLRKAPEPEPLADTDESSSVFKKPSQPTVLFVAHGQESTSGLLKPLPRKDKSEKKDKRQTKPRSAEKAMPLTKKTSPQEKPEEPPAKPKPPVTRPPPPTAKLDPLNDRKEEAKPEPLKRDEAVRPRPSPRRKETVDSTADQSKPQPQTRSEQTSSQELKPSSSPKVKPPRPAKGPVVKSSGDGSPSTSNPLGSVEKTVTKPVQAAPQTPSGTSPAARPHQVRKEKPARPPAPQSDSKPKPGRPPPPKSSESAKEKPSRPQTRKSALEKKSITLRKAIATYHAQRPDELTFNEGDLIVEVQPVDEHGWCKGKLTSTGQEGMYPGNFVESA